MKLYYYKDSSKTINYFETKKEVEIPDKYIEKPVRAFWVSTVLNLDLPQMENEAQYKEKLDEMFEVAKAYNINTIYFQVRPTNDAFYKSKLNPYSKFLTGIEGKEPSFDVLEYVVEKGRKENVEIHAWCNPYRVSLEKKKGQSKEDYLKTLDDKNFAKQHPELVVTDSKGQLILNPTREEVKQFIVDSMMEIVENYDVDGIHWDDYFYPYSPLSEDDNDLNEYANRNNKELSLGDFRRYHVSDVIKRVFKSIKKYDSNIMFGVSPFGIWRGKNTDSRGSNTHIETSQSYDDQYADSYEWVKKGYIDYIIPQLYWEFGHKLAPFADLTKWWSDLVKGTNVDLYIGHGPYRLGREGEYENPLEIVNQVKYANQYDEVKGNAFFTYATFLNNEKAKKGMEELRKLLKKEMQDEKKKN